MFQSDPDLNMWWTFLKLIGLLIGVYLWGKLSSGWINKK